jgi:hypothetical protein
VAGDPVTPKSPPLVVNDAVELLDPPAKPRLAPGLRGRVVEAGTYWGLVRVRWTSGRQSLLAEGRLRRLEPPR